ncbi:TPA: hypothetical protein DCZ16_05075 [Candidatus Peregrinibacteria bacterium]|nr:hypothetical protein [Candidatus Peregrinibacteria bacterium]
MKTILAILLAVLVVAVAVIYFWQNGNFKKWQKELLGEKPAISKNLFKNVTFPVRCSGLGEGWMSYTDQRMKFSFCYKKEWGVPKLEDLTSTPSTEAVGKSWSLAFTNNPEGKRFMEYFPISIGYQTLDFAIKGDVSPGPFIIDWEKIDFSKTEARLTKVLLSGEKDIKLSKVKVAGHDALKETGFFVGMDGAKEYVTKWLVPKTMVDEKYNLEISVYDEKYAEDAEKMVNSMKF